MSKNSDKLISDYNTENIKHSTDRQMMNDVRGMSPGEQANFIKEVIHGVPNEGIKPNILEARRIWTYLSPDERSTLQKQGLNLKAFTKDEWSKLSGMESDLMEQSQKQEIDLSGVTEKELSQYRAVVNDLIAEELGKKKYEGISFKEQLSMIPKIAGTLKDNLQARIQSMFAIRLSNRAAYALIFGGACFFILGMSGSAVDNNDNNDISNTNGDELGASPNYEAAASIPPLDFDTAVEVTDIYHAYETGAGASYPTAIDSGNGISILMTKYHDLEGNYTDNDIWKAECAFEGDEIKCTETNTNISTPNFVEGSPVKARNGDIYFSSNQHDPYDTDAYKTPYDHIEGAFNDSYSQAPCDVSADGNTLYYRRATGIAAVRLDETPADAWWYVKGIRENEFPGDKISCGLSPDGNTLYIASKRGSQYDIYKMDRDTNTPEGTADEVWKDATLLNSNINTSGQEYSFHVIEAPGFADKLLPGATNLAVFMRDGKVFVSAVNPGPIDSDGDGTPDDEEECDYDPNKTDPGQCGCGEPDLDPDLDGVASCIDNCDDIANDQSNMDGDESGDACDPCASDPTNTCDDPPEQSESPDPAHNQGSLVIKQSAVKVIKDGHVTLSSTDTVTVSNGNIARSDYSGEYKIIFPDVADGEASECYFGPYTDFKIENINCQPDGTVQIWGIVSTSPDAPDPVNEGFQFNCIIKATEPEDDPAKKDIFIQVVDNGTLIDLGITGTDFGGHHTDGETFIQMYEGSAPVHISYKDSPETAKTEAYSLMNIEGVPGTAEIRINPPDGDGVTTIEESNEITQYPANNGVKDHIDDNTTPEKPCAVGSVTNNAEGKGVSVEAILLIVSMAITRLMKRKKKKLQ